MNRVAIITLSLALTAVTTAQEPPVSDAISRFNGIMMMYNDSYFGSGNEVNQKEVAKNLKSHYQKFGKCKANAKSYKILKQEWEPSSKHGKVVIKAEYFNSSDTIYVYYAQISSPQISRVHIKYLGFASQMSEVDADKKVGSLKGSWKNSEFL